VKSGCLRFHEEYQSDKKGEIRNSSSFVDCQRRCEQNPECKFWSWIRPSRVNRNKCFLFDSEKVSLIPNSSAISGHKFCKGKSVLETGFYTHRIFNPDLDLNLDLIKRT
jgi:hypothetical protein